MKWAKPHVDVGLMVREPAPMLAFYQDEVGLRFDHVLSTGGGNQQHRHDMNGSVLKLNASRRVPPELPPAGYSGLRIARSAVEAPCGLLDPEGNFVSLVPSGHDGVVGIGIEVAVRDASAHAAFYTDALGLDAEGEGRFRCGDSLFFVTETPDAPADAGIQGTGFRYVTLQVFDCDAATERALAAGARLGAPARTLGDVARFSMVRDPDGNWVELSQRKSLTGDLPR